MSGIKRFLSSFHWHWLLIIYLNFFKSNELEPSDQPFVSIAKGVHVQSASARVTLTQFMHGLFIYVDPGYPRSYHDVTCLHSS